MQSRDRWNPAHQAAREARVEPQARAHGQLAASEVTARVEQLVEYVRRVGDRAEERDEPRLRVDEEQGELDHRAALALDAVEVHADIERGPRALGIAKQLAGDARERRRDPVTHERCPQPSELMVELRLEVRRLAQGSDHRVYERAPADRIGDPIELAVDTLGRRHQHAELA